MMLAEAISAVLAALLLPQVARAGRPQAGSHHPEFVDRLRNDSACSGAIKHYGAPGIRPLTFTWNLGGRTSSLMFLGAGQGTTGTRNIADLLCQYHIPTLHWSNSCFLDPVTNEKHRNLMQTWLCLQFGTCPFYFNTADRSKEILRLKVREQLHDLLLYGNMKAILDTPYSFLVHEILTIAPKAYVILSVRDPKDWVDRRAHVHLTETVCRDGHHHPLDILYCDDEDSVGTEGMKPMYQLSSTELAQLQHDYADYNARIRDAVHPSRLREVCVWDGGLESFELTLRKMGYHKLSYEAKARQVQSVFREMRGLYSRDAHNKARSHNSLHQSQLPRQPHVASDTL